MTVSREKLAAYADGQLPAEEASHVAEAVAADPTLAAQVEAHRALRARLSAHFDPILDEPVPDQLHPQSPERGGNVINLATVRSLRGIARAPWTTWPRSTRSVAVGGALAAALALVVMAGPWMSPAPVGGLSRAQLAALDGQPSGVRNGEASAVLLSFVDRQQRPCRVFEAGQRAGIACRNSEGWDSVWSGPASGVQGGEMRQANSAGGSAFSVAQEMAVRTLDAEQERRAIDEGWTSGSY